VVEGFLLGTNRNGQEKAGDCQRKSERFQHALRIRVFTRFFLLNPNTKTSVSYSGQTLLHTDCSEKLMKNVVSFLITRPSLWCMAQVMVSSLGKAMMIWFEMIGATP
jgi:hypothetical protein